MGSPERPQLRIIGGNPEIIPHSPPPMPTSKDEAIETMMVHLVKLDSGAITEKDKEDVWHMKEHRISRNPIYWDTVGQMAIPMKSDDFDPDPAA